MSARPSSSSRRSRPPGAEVLSVGVLASLSQALFFAGDLDEAQRIAVQAVERADAPDVPDGYVVSLGLLALHPRRARTNGSAEAWARQAIGFARKRYQADSWVASRAHLGLALACTAIGALDEADREALRGERLRRSPQPTVGHTHALLVLAHVRVARSRLERAASDLKRAQKGDRGVSRSGAATCDRGYRRAGPHHRQSDCGQPSSRRGAQRGRARRPAVPRDRSLPARDWRATLHLSEHRQDPHPRAVPQARRNIASGCGRARRSARPAQRY